MYLIGNHIKRSPGRAPNIDFYLIWLVYGSYIPVSNRILIDKAIVPTNNNALLMILFFLLRENKSHKIKIIATNINATPKPIFKVFSPPGI